MALLEGSPNVKSGHETARAQKEARFSLAAQGTYRVHELVRNRHVLIPTMLPPEPVLNYRTGSGNKPADAGGSGDRDWMPEMMVFTMEDYGCDGNEPRTSRGEQRSSPRAPECPYYAKSRGNSFVGSDLSQMRFDSMLAKPVLPFESAFYSSTEAPGPFQPKSPGSLDRRPIGDRG